MKFRPLHNNILARRVDKEEVSAGGLIIPEQAQEDSGRAIIVAVGAGHMLPDGRRVPLDVNVEDTVLIGKHAGLDIQLNGEDYLVLIEDDILGVVEPE